jgi:hypothetical protein
MRYYAIEIEGANGTSFPLVPGAEVPGAQFSSVAYGMNDPGALKCQMYIEMLSAHQANTGSWVRLWGVGLDQISQSNNLNGSEIHVYGGMFPGLPLATEQSRNRGLLLCGTIQTAFGNWQGTDMSLDLLIWSGTKQQPAGSSGASGGELGGSGSSTPSRLMNRRTQRYSTNRTRVPEPSVPISPLPQDIIGDLASSVGLGQFSGIFSSLAASFGGGGFGSNPVNMIHNLLAGMPFSSAIQQTLSKAFPNTKLNINISPGLLLPYQDSGFYQNLQQYAGYLKTVSQSILGSSGYPGIRIAPKGCELNITDGTSGGHKTVILNYTDIIGQPTWISATDINIKCVMRSDIDLYDIIELPKDIPVSIALTGDTSPGFFAGTGLNSLTLGFTGQFSVQSMWHVGDSRHPDGAQWCTVLQAQTLDSISNQIFSAAASTAVNVFYNAVAPIFGGAGSSGTAPSSNPRFANRRTQRYR